MDVETTIKVMRLSYPIVTRTRFGALHHLFCVNGNGYEWKDGELVAVDADDDARKAAIEIVTCEHDHPMPFDRIDREIAHARKCGGRSAWDSDPTTYSWYPLCEYSEIMKVPDDVKPDWKAEAITIAKIMAGADESWVRDCAMANKKLAKKILKKLGT